MDLIGIDFEARSRADLGDVGGTKYARDPSTQVLCLGYGRQAYAPNIWRPDQPDSIGGFPRGLAAAAADPDQVFVAHNAQFDRTMWKVHLTERHGIPLPRRWLCTATRASVNGLPRGLDECCEALGMPGKNKEGEKALKIMMKPDKKTGLFIDTPELRALTEHYCTVDITRMWQIADRTKPLSEWEQAYFELDMEINERGFAVDRPGVERVLERLEEAYAELELRVWDATNGDLRNIRSLPNLAAWLALQGVELPNYRAETLTAFVEYADQAGIPVNDNVREVLTLRKLASAKSPSKFKAFKQRGMEEGDDTLIMRDCFIVNGAHTGRHTAKGFQSQNMMRECASEFDIDVLLTEPLPAVRALVGEPLTIAGQTVRPMVKARKGKKLLIGDFSRIETCVLFALAGEKRGLEMLRSGADLYRDLATRIYKKPANQITGFERQLGKQGILGCGFGVGAETFIATCAKYGIKLDLETSKLVVSTYRDEYSSVKKLWFTVETAIQAALWDLRASDSCGMPVLQSGIEKTGPQKIKNRDNVVLLKIAADENQLVIILPSGRKLRYREARMINVKKRDGDDAHLAQRKSNRTYAISYMREDPKNKQWLRYETWGGSFVENIVQAIANDLQREAALRLRAFQFDIVLHAHDELVAEDDESALEMFGSVMSFENEPLQWAVDMGIPIKVDLKASERYRKAA